MPEEKSEKDKLDMVIAKLDSLEKEINNLKPKTDSVPKEDPDIALAKEILKANLGLDKAKLDSLSFHDLLIAQQVVNSLKPAKQLPNPPVISKLDSDDDEMGIVIGGEK